MPVYGDISVTATTAANPQLLWPANGEKGFGNIIEVTNNSTGVVDLYVNAPIHGSDSWYAIAPGVTKAIKNNASPGTPTKIYAYAASAINARVFPNAA